MAEKAGQRANNAKYLKKQTKTRKKRKRQERNTRNGSFAPRLVKEVYLFILKIIYAWTKNDERKRDNKKRHVSW